MNSHGYLGDIDKKLYIHNVDMLFKGQPLWKLGQGGITKIEKPAYIGVVERTNSYHRYHESGHLYVPDTDFFVTKLRTEKRKPAQFDNNSYMDRHILPQTYNNWYIVDDPVKGEQIVAELQSRWTDEFEQYRQERMKY